MNDTHPVAERIQLEVIGRMSVREKMDRFFDLNQWAYEMSRRAIAEAFPHLSEREQVLKFIELHYGKDLAEQVRHDPRASLDAAA